MVRVVIFDLDDTLISERKYIQSGYHYIAELVSRRVQESEQELYHLLMTLLKQSPKNVFNRLFETLGIAYTNGDILELVEQYRSHSPIIDFYDDVLPCLEYLKGMDIKLGIITDGYANAQRQKLKVIQADDYFDEIIVTDELGKKYWKPHPKSFEKMRDLFNVRFSDMVYIGDNIAKDFITPNRLGMITVHINREGGIYNQDMQDYEHDFHALYSIKSIYDLPDLFKI